MNDNQKSKLNDKLTQSPSLPVNASIISLTLNEKNVLEYIERFIEHSGIAPTYQEIKEHFGFASFNSVQRYLKQLQSKGYIGLPGGNQKRAMTLLRPSSALRESLTFESRPKSLQPRRDNLSTEGSRLFGRDLQQQPIAVSTPTRIPAVDGPQRELLSLPLLGKVAAGRPLEALKNEEFTEVPPNMVRNPDRTFTLEVSGNSMIEDGIFNGDILIVQEQKTARNGEISVCVVENEATVKRFYLHQGERLARPQVELRPANSELESMWYSPDQVEVRGIVVGLLRTFR